MRYWISRSPGEVEGPFDVPTLQAMIEEGAIPSTTQLCLEGTETWQSLRSVRALQPDTSTVEAPPTDVAAAQELVDAKPSPIAGREFSIGNAFELGWNCVIQNYALILCMVLMWIGMVVAVNVFTGVASVLTGLTAAQQVPPVGGPPVWGGAGFVGTMGWTNPWEIGGNIVEFLVITPYLLGVAIVIIRLLRGESMQWSDSWCAFRGGNYIRVVLIQLCWLGLGILFLIAMGMIVGLPLLLINGMNNAMTPGAEVLLFIGLGFSVLFVWYFYLRLGFTNFIVLDPMTHRPPLLECFKISWEATRGWSTLGSLIVLGISVVGISIITIIMCFLPFILIGFPVIYGIIMATYALLLANNSRFHDGNRCVHCGYQRSTDSSTICSECGRPWNEDPGTSEATGA
ncbi:MAG: hypothetical protein CBC35_05335 [Planctomycetes bacterium TMED75]|nr:hypothetical protein [Planctomycetaceae bacterium]OUU93576.1 MAG: hypothetical protein CBC35_05335 [Planctomycetes bacterium TMED75]